MEVFFLLIKLNWTIIEFLSLLRNKKYLLLPICRHAGIVVYRFNYSLRIFRHLALPNCNWRMYNAKLIDNLVTGYPIRIDFKCICKEHIFEVDSVGHLLLGDRYHTKLGKKKDLLVITSNSLLASADVVHSSLNIICLHLHFLHNLIVV